jgi:hypothetical protein
MKTPEYWEGPEATESFRAIGDRDSTGSDSKTKEAA